MAASLYIVVEGEDPGFDIFVNGQALARNEDALERLAERLKVRPLLEFFSADENSMALLLEQGHAAEAEEVYRDDLGLSGRVQRCTQHPDNVWALHGIVECLRRRGETEEHARLNKKLVDALACEIARNSDPLRAVFASNRDPSALCVSVSPYGPGRPGRGLGDDVRGRDRRYPARLFRAAPAD